MDDDIFAALGALDDDDEDGIFSAPDTDDSPDTGDSAEDDIFSTQPISDADDELEDLFRPVEIARSEASTSGSSDEPEWLTDTFGDFQDAQTSSNIASEAFEEEKERSGFMADGGPFKGMASSGRFLGMTPMQRMVLSVFLFIDVSILGCLLLVAIGALQF